MIRSTHMLAVMLALAAAWGGGVAARGGPARDLQASDLQAKGLVRSTDRPSSVGEAFLKLVDKDASPAARRGAAMMLLNVDNDEALRALSSVLHEGVSPTAWRAVAQAVALSPGHPPDVLAARMLGLLGEADASIQPVLAQALGRYDDQKLVRRLQKAASDSAASIHQRRGAILALGWQRTQKAARDLMSLTNLDQPEKVQAAAYDALTTLAGLTAYGRNRSLWRDWWRHARQWSQKTWRRRLMDNLSRQDIVRRRRQQEIERRLIKSQRAVYRTTTAADRPAVLAYMLNDPLAVIRNLAIDLSLERLVDNLPVTPPLRKALRARLDDPAPNLRRRSALLLRDLADSAAADHVAQKLARNQEQWVAALRADLKLVTRMPRPAAVEPALALLDEPTLRGEAAGALAAAADAGLLSNDQVAAAADRLHAALRRGHPPPPQVATLLARVGDQADWSRLARWIDRSDPALKRAAASAWAHSHHSLQLLADRASDPIIEPIVVAAAARKGEDPWTLRALVEHRPGQPQAVDAWEAALVAMAGRVPAPVVLEAAHRLAQLNQPMGLLDRLLSAAIPSEAIQAPISGDPDDQAAAVRRVRQRIALRLTRAAIRLRAGRPADALIDYKKIVAAAAALPSHAGLDDQTIIRIDRGRLRAHLMAGETKKAFAAARDLLRVAPHARASVDAVVDRFLAAARRQARSGHADAAAQVLVGLRKLIGPAMKPEVAQRIALLEAHIARHPPAAAPAGHQRPRQDDGGSPHAGPARTAAAEK